MHGASRTFPSDGEQYLVATIITQRRGLSRARRSLGVKMRRPHGIVESDVLAILGTTDEMLKVCREKLQE